MDPTIKGVSTSGLSNQLQRPAAPQDTARLSKDNPALSQKADAMRKAGTAADAVRVGREDAIATLERSLPLAILQRPNLLRAEWAWRRLLTDVAQGGFTSDPLEANRTTPQPASAGAMPQPTVATTDASSELPSSAGPHDPAVIHPNQPAVTQSIEALWKSLAAVAILADAGGRGRNLISLPNAFVQQMLTDDGKGGLVPFQNIRPEHELTGMSEKLKHWVLEDRWTSAARGPDVPLTGGGLWVMPAPPREKQTMAVRWQAERQTERDRNGRTVHRLQLTLTYQEHPVRVQFIASHPVVQIHVGTNHRPLQTRLKESADIITGALQGLGWSLHSWSVGDWDGGEAE